jgi:phosphoserine phosphatase
MNYIRNACVRHAFVLLALLCALSNPAFAADPLPSWRAGANKQAIVDFVTRVTDPRHVEHVPLPERIAVFDNDGTLWAEQPMYFQVLFAFDRLRALAPAHPEWRDKPVFKAVLDGDMKGALQEGERGLIEVVVATHAGDIDSFRAEVKSWLAQARHPGRDIAYTGMVYQPMLELLAYLRANGFQTWIVSGGDVEFMRAFAERVYGVPPERVIGSRLRLALDEDGKLVRNGFDWLNDKENKVLGIAQALGRRPILAFGNSDGDLAMLRWTMQGKGARFAGLVHHTDAAREFAYDRTSHIGRLDKGLDAASAGGWRVVDMAADWAQVFPPR